MKISLPTELTAKKEPAYFYKAPKQLKDFCDLNQPVDLSGCDEVEALESAMRATNVKQRNQRLAYNSAQTNFPLKPITKLALVTN